MNYIIPLFTAIPLGAAFITSLIGRYYRRAGDILANLASLVLLGLSFFTLLTLNTKPSAILVYKVGGWIPPIGICMVIDGLACFMLIVVNLIAFLVTIYSIGYMERYTAKWKFYTLFLLMLAGMNGVIITGDMFNLYVFLEIAAIASYALVAFGTEKEELEASFKYAVMGIVASAFILLGIALLYSYTSTLNMADMSLTLQQKDSPLIVLFVSVLFIMGFGLKSALVPFHAWLPDAHPSAPAPISAILSGVLIKTLGIYALARIFFSVFGETGIFLQIFLILGAVSMLAGGFLAIGQMDIKRMLAYSSISQIGYIFLGLGIGTPLGILGGLFHLINHSVFKSLLFLNSGAIEYSTGTRNLREMGGLNHRLPVTGYSSLVGSMSISGIPPFSGFWSKLIIIIAAIQANHLGYAIIAVMVGILTLAYYLKLQKFAFFGKLDEKWERIKEVPLTMQLSMIILAVICIIGGLLLIPYFRFFLDAAKDTILFGRDYANLVLEAVR